MRILTSQLLRRRSSKLPSPPLLNFFSNDSSSCSSSHSITSPSNYRNRRRQHDYYNHSGFSTIQSLSHHSFISFSRQFSTEPELPETGEPSLPTRTLISLLDSYHDFTGFPWWIVISSSTVAMRLALVPITILQLKKSKKIAEMLRTLPPPFPPPLSGRSFRDQFSHFLKEKEAAGCPSLLWFVASFAVQVPCFLLWVMSIRTMSLHHHAGFDTGGVLWFHNLTEYSNGMWGPILPLAIAGLYFTNIQISFGSSLQEVSGSLGLLAKLYKMYLQLMTLPIMFIAFNVPQGSLVYWVTNASLSLLQTICLRNPVVREYLGLNKINTPAIAPTNPQVVNPGVADGTSIQTKQGQIPAGSLSPMELVNYSIKVSSDGRTDLAKNLLRLAIKKDPDHVRAWVILGQILSKGPPFTEATECLETAVSKVVLVSHPSEEEIDLLILSSMWAGINHMKQGNAEKGLIHLERIGQMDEPVDEKCKLHYYDGLLMLSSALLRENRTDEGLQYLQKLAAYDPKYKMYLKQVENDLEDISSDLSSSRRDF